MGGLARVRDRRHCRRDDGGDAPAAVNPDAAATRSPPISGTASRIDRANRVIVSDGARMSRVTGDGAVPVDNSAVEWRTLTPGQRVRVVAAGPVTFEDARDIVVLRQASPVAGTVARIDEPSGVIALSDGRAFRIGPSSVILVDGRPVALAGVRPGMAVTVSAAHPVVYRNGRYALVNIRFVDPDTGASLSWDSVYAGYESETSDAGMQVPSA